MLVQVAAIEAFTAVLDLRLLAGADVVEVLLPSVLANINIVGSTDEVCQSRLPSVVATIFLLATPFSMLILIARCSATNS